MQSVLVNIDIKGFASLSRGKADDDVAQILKRFYEKVNGAIPKTFRIVKTTGDSILISTESKLDAVTENQIRELKAALDKSNPVKISYRLCSYEPKTIELGGYRCEDVFGDDVNNLFISDDKTVVLD